MPPGSDEYFAALRQARERGFAISAEALRQVDAALAAAAREVAIQIGRGADPLQRQRLASLLEQIIGVLDELGDRIARVTSQGVNLTINDLLRIHERINSALSNRFLGRGVIGLGASFDRLPARILGILAARPGGSARTFRTLINRHLLEAAPSLDVLLTQSIVRGVPISRLARDIAGLLTNPPGTTLPWVDPSQASGFSTIRSDSRRIAASETLNALRETNAQALNVSPLVLAVRWQRSGRHDAITSSPDECDILAETDFHGLGAGFYPPDLWPLAPHPYCGCYQGEVQMRPPSEWGRGKPPSPPADLSRFGRTLERLGVDWSEARIARAERTVSRSLGRKPHAVVGTTVIVPPPKVVGDFTAESESADEARLAAEMKKFEGKKGTKAEVTGIRFDLSGKVVSGTEVNDVLMDNFGIDSAEDFVRRIAAIPDDWKLRITTLNAETDVEFLDMQAVMYDANGTRRGSIRRQVYGNESKVHHDLLALDKEVAAKGLGKQLLREQIDLYLEMGIETVDTFANIDVGGYAWARYGFIPESVGAWKSLAFDLRAKMNNLQWEIDVTPKITQGSVIERAIAEGEAFTKIKENLTKILASNDPRAIRLVAASPGGKELLLDTHWNAVLDLTDEATMSIFRAYTGVE